MKRTDALPVYPFGATSNQQPATSNQFNKDVSKCRRSSPALFQKILIPCLLMLPLLLPSSVSGQSDDTPCAFTDDDPPSCNTGDLTGCSYGPLSGQHPEDQCDLQNENLFVIKTFVHLLRDENGQGGPSWERINLHFNKMIKVFAPIGILFSIEGWDYIDLPPNLYDYQGEETEFQDLIKLNAQNNRLDLYFFGNGIYDNGRANPMYKSNPACVIGDGVTNSGIPFYQTVILAHEVGHSLGLLHTFEIACDASSCTSVPTPCLCGDFVYDTPPGQNTNVMSYSHETQQKEFTEGQKRRMKKYLTNCQNLQPLVTGSAIRVPENFILTYDAAFDQDYCLPGFVVEQDARLTLKTGMSFQENKNIIVETGGRLIVDGATLTGCDDDPWGGIIVKGSPAVPQVLSPLNQGYVGLHGAVLENAETSLRVEGGGIVFAYNSDIVNCGGAWFYPYPYHNISRFQYCDFTHDGFEPETASLLHVWLLGVRDVTFTACNFTNVNNSSSFAPGGIIALGSGFYVHSSNFDGFYNAITNYGCMGPPTKFSVYNNTFENNLNGIYCLNQANFTIINNEFNIGGAPFNQSGMNATGITMDNCKAYRIEKNTFTGVSSSAMRYGTLTQNSGSQANFINGNYFDYLDVANQAQGNNRGDFSGLQYWCNVNQGNNLRDFLVTASGNGIALSQGNGKATRDTFSHDGTLDYSDFLNEVGVIDFYHRNLSLEIPQYYSGTNLFQVNTFQACPQDATIYVADDKLTPTEKENARQGYLDAKTGYQSEKTDRLDLIDGGDTESLLEDIANATANEANTLRANLSAISPYLSSAALEAVINRNDIFSDAIISGILTANPDELRNPTLRDLIGMEFSPGMRDTILSFTGTTTARTTQENLIAGYRTDMHYNANLLIRDLLSDTLGYEMDTLLMWLHNKGSLESGYEMAAAYLSTGDTTAAYQIFDDIPQMYELTEEQETEHDLYRELVEFWVTLQQEETHLWELDSIQLAYLTGLAENSSGPAGASARGFLNALYGAHYLVVPELPNGGPEALILPPAAGFKSIMNTHAVTAFPNPAHNSVTFSWRLPDEQEATIIITDLNGKVIEKIAIIGKKGKIEWKTHGAESGIYLCRMNFPNGKFEVSKLVLIK